MANIGFDSTAIAWALAHNSEQAQTFVDEQKKFRKDVKDSFTATKDALEKAGWVPGSEEDDPKLEEDIYETIPDSGDVYIDTGESDQPGAMNDLTDGVYFGGSGPIEIDGVKDNYTLKLSLHQGIVNELWINNHQYDVNRPRSAGGWNIEIYNSSNEVVRRWYSVPNGDAYSGLFSINNSDSHQIGAKFVGWHFDVKNVHIWGRQKWYSYNWDGSLRDTGYIDKSNFADFLTDMVGAPQITWDKFDWVPSNAYTLSKSPARTLFSQGKYIVTRKYLAAPTDF